MKRGSFITLEGPEGCGKSTQAQLLSVWLTERHRSVVSTREPGGTRIGDAIRALLLDAGNHGMVSHAELLLYSASRAQLVDEVVRPALAAGRIVLCDRFHDSTTAYQGYGLGLDLDMIRELHRWVLGDCWPDITIILDLDPEVGMQRKFGDQLGDAPQADRIEARDLDFHRRVMDGYRAEAARDPERCHLVPADQAPEDVHAQIVDIVTAHGIGVR